jgi:diguanylate cyclase (GGDEF)-like protein
MTASLAMHNPGELQAKLAALSDTYAAQLPEKIKNLQQSFTRLSETEWNNRTFESFVRLVHGLIGSSRTFGFDSLGDMARRLEEYLRPLAQAKVILDKDQRNHISEAILEMHQAMLHRDVSLADQSGLIAIVQVGRDAVVPRRIFVVEDEHELAEELKVQLGYFGYDVTVFNTLEDFRLALRQTSDVVVLMDITFPENRLGGAKLMNEIQRERENPIPVVFLSAHDEFESRLEAARAGSIAYLCKPVNIGNLIDKLDTLTSTKPLESYRVMIVDDSVALTAYHTVVLEQAGMVVKAVNNPFNVIEALIEFTPDLILIDLYMPECNGTDLAKVIRQLDAFVSIPIVFLSAESDLDKQLFAMGLGGDDFLTKPIQPQHLVSSVTSRIRRSLMLRSFMVRDSLTGLLNHTAIKDLLYGEVAGAIRQKKHLSFAMIDIDYFKQINDSHGHPAGDRVIKSLSRLLKQRLRSSDLVGRYGGEEFAVVLVDADRSTAMKVLDNIREDFSQLRHLAGDKEFMVTFSCGIADVSQFPNTAKLSDAADKALYKAKHAGRNRVMLADVHSAYAGKNK